MFNDQRQNQRRGTVFYYKHFNCFRDFLGPNGPDFHEVKISYLCDHLLSTYCNDGL